MLAKKLGKYTTLFSSIIFMFLGVSCFLTLNSVLKGFLLAFSISLVAIGIYRGIVTFFIYDKKRRRMSDVVASIFFVIIGVTLILNEGSFKFALTIVFAIWVSVLAIIDLIIAVIYKKDGEKKWYAFLVQSLISFSFSAAIILSSKLATMVLSTLFGVYFFTYSLFLLVQFFLDLNLLESVFAMKLKRLLTIFMPLFIDAFIPQRLIKKIQTDYSETDNIKKLNQKGNFDGDRTNLKPNIEVYVHLSESIKSSFGHLDIVIGDTIISYGNYDNSTNRFLNLISDGVLISVQKQPYLKYCLNHENKIIIGYKILVSDSELESIRKSLEEMIKNFERWYPKSYYEKNNLPTPYFKPVQFDPASDFYLYDNYVQFFKGVHKRYKTYFVMGTNCAKIVNEILKPIGFRNINFGATLTPGTCYRFFEDELSEPKSAVIERNIYIKTKK